MPKIKMPTLINHGPMRALAITSSAWTAALFAATIAVVPHSAMAALLFGTNLVSNGDAEAGLPGTTVPSFVSSAGATTVVSYSAGGGFPGSTDPGPANRGNNFFTGGDGQALSRITQTVSVADGAVTIDAGAVTFELSAFLGGFSVQNDFAQFSVTFLGAGNAQLGTSTLTGPNGAERGGQTGLLQRSLNASVPVGTRSLVFTLQATRTSGSYNDGYADNLSFVAAQAAVSPVPEPASLALVAMGVAGFAAVRRHRF